MPEFVNEAVSSQNISISRADWDAHETSWDFKTNELISLRNQSIKEGESEKGLKLSSLVDEYKKRWEDNFMQLHANEEELNRQFIEIYGLQDELTPDVPLNEITILQQGEISIERVQTSSSLERMPSDERLGDSQISIEEEKIVWHDDVLIKQLISYAVGCMMGRYSLDEPGLIYAHAGNQNFDASRYQAFQADADGIIPLTEMHWFEDDATHRIQEFLTAVWGKDTLDANMLWLAESLDKKASETAEDTIRRYLASKFYKDHMQTYKKRPIYWLFSSGKQGAFQALVYLHRYNESTLARMRTEYVMPLISKMAAYANSLETAKESSDSAAEIKRIEKKLQDLHKQQAELSSFEEKLRHYADQRISLDLDDGVKVNYGKFGDLLANVKDITGGSGGVMIND